MEKLQLRHICQYLPFGLKGYADFLPSTPLILQGIKKDLVYCVTKEGNKIPMACSIAEFKPILYDLSFLTKEIEHNGERFVPVLYWDSMGGNFTEYQRLKHLLNDMVVTNRFQPALPYFVYQKLIEWHFAVNIPEHLYINKNTLDI